jgi:ribonuclease P protein component
LSKAAYAAVFADAQRLSAGCFLLLYAPSAASGPRLGLAIARRHAPTAVERNRVKRLVRESFRQRWKDLAPVDAVLMLRAPTLPVSAATLRNALDGLWDRLSRPSPPTPAEPA